MGILDGIVEWLSQQVMNGLDLITTSVLGALGCNMDTFLRYFPAAETMYSIFVAVAVGLTLLNFIWQLFRNFGLIAGVEAEDPIKLTIRTIMFIGLIYYSDQITDIILIIGGTPYSWILTSGLQSVNFSSFHSVLLTILGSAANYSVTLIALILILVLAWNYIKLLFEAAERYILLGVMIYTAPVAFATGASQATANVFKAWCRMFGGQIFLLFMNAWCLRLFTSMVGSFIADPLSIGSDTSAGNFFIWFLCAIAFLKISQKMDSFLAGLGLHVGHTGDSLFSELMIAAKGITSARKSIGNTNIRGGSFYAAGSTLNSSSVLTGGLAGTVGRYFTQSAMNTVTGAASNPISRHAFDASLKKGGDFANSVIGAVAQGSIQYTGTMKGSQAAEALSSFLGQSDMPDSPAFSQVEIGGGRIMGTETSVSYPNGTSFGMYSTDQYMPPEGNYETITAADNSTWYRQYATDFVERIPYMTSEGQIAYRESIIQKLPDMPKRKDRV